MLETLKTKNAPAAIGPYSQAIIADPHLYASGQIPLDPKTGEIVGVGIEEQTVQVFKNIKGILDSAGSSFNQIIKTTCYLQSIDDFPAFNEVYSRYFTDHLPARSCVEVAALPKGALVEIEFIAQVPLDRRHVSAVHFL